MDTMAVLEVRSPASGRAKCPYDPLSIYSFAYVGMCNYGNYVNLILLSSLAYNVACELSKYASNTV